MNLECQYIKHYEGYDWCNLSANPCFKDTGECEEYNELLLTDEEIQIARLLTPGEIKIITQEAIDFANEHPDVPEAYQLRSRELAGALSGSKIARAQLDRFTWLLRHGWLPPEKHRLNRPEREDVAKAMYYQHVSSDFKWENEGQWFRDKYLGYADQLLAILDNYSKYGERRTK